MIATVIAKPTKVCNATCAYCSAPPDGAPQWRIEDFQTLFDRLAPHLSGEAVIIWHGGEPMLMGPDFYRRAWDHVQRVKPGVRFSIQSNLLGYDSKRWRDVFRDIFAGSISTSWDPDETYREFRGSTALYSRIFWSRLDRVIGDGFFPKVIGTYTEDTAPRAHEMYDRALSYGTKTFDLRFNYRYPAGRDAGKGAMIAPESYGAMLLELYERWIVDLPEFMITPLDEMLKRVIGLEVGRCPWTRACGGRFLGIEPSGDTYNCSEFADLGDPEYLFGNIFSDTVPEMMRTAAARKVKRRRVDLPFDCTSCRHFQQCEGGCMRDALLYHRGIGGKFYYCASWMMVFDRIKQSLASGEADGAVRKLGRDPARLRRDLGMRPRPGEEVAA